MNVRAIKTAETNAALVRVQKMSTKKFDLGVSLEVPKEFVEKRNYMQSDEFINDAHNRKMLELGDDFYTLRCKVADEVKMLNQRMNNKFVQAINGFVRQKKDIEKDYYMNFEDIPVVYTPSEAQYRIVRNVQMYAASRNFLV